jgi:hypothetical protein
VLVAYNMSGQARNDCIIVDASIHKKDDKMNFLYGKSGSTTVRRAPTGALYVQRDLDSWQFAILE